MNRQQSPRLRLAAVFITAAALATLLIGASQVGTRAADPPGPAPAASSTEPIGTSASSLLAGVEQEGAALGSAKAPVTLVEYADLQCPYCAEWARVTLPTLVADYVRTGKLRIVFRGLAFIGSDSDDALRTAIAAGRDDHLWDVVHGLFENQGAENTGWVTDGLVAEIARSIPGLYADQILDARWGNGVEAEMTRAARAAQAAGINGTPAFEIGPTGGRLQVPQISSLEPEGIVPAIEEVLAR
jgi:protein-disulfide isomerase